PATWTRFGDGETLCLPLVGGRSYVRALDLVALCEARVADFSELRLRFRRPLPPLSRIERARSLQSSAEGRLRGDGEEHAKLLPTPLGSTAERAAEPPPSRHWSLKRRGANQLHLIDGRAGEYAKLAVVFRDFQDASGERYAVRNLVLRRTP